MHVGMHVGVSSETQSVDRLLMWPTSDQIMVFHSFVMDDHELCGVVDAPAA